MGVMEEKVGDDFNFLRRFFGRRMGGVMGEKVGGFFDLTLL